jgi:hypothetical protein
MRFKINKILTASLFACMLMGGFLFNSCKSDEPNLTTIKLNAFGPSAALRGGELKFIGTNMDKVTAVDLPGTAEITTFVSKSSTEIVIAIPQDAMPGLVVLKTPQGDITTKTPLTFTEPILITNFSPATVKAGDVLTINGDYLNLIKQVIFSDGVVADSTAFGTKTRKQLTVTVPAEAKTGKVAISNGAAIPILVYTATELQVTLPAITASAPNPVKAGTALQITGTNFQLVKSIIFTDGLTVTNFTLNADKTGITVIVPATAKDGKVTLVAKSGVQIQSASSLIMVAPTITSVAPNPVKNGATLTVTGTDLDLVTGATFGGAVAGTISSQSATNLVLTVPLTAVDGPVVLSTNSGKTVSSAALTYVKPTITSFAPTELMAGGDITITGTDLDLVSNVIFVGNFNGTIKTTTATSLVVTVPPACVGTSTFTLKTTNESQVVSGSTLIVDAANKPVITGITSSVKPGGLLTITGTKLNLIESIYFQTNVKAVLYGVRTETSIEVYVPETAKKGAVTLTLNAFDGSQIVSPTFTISGTDPVLDKSYVFFDFDGKNSWWGDKGAIENLPELTLDGSNYFRINDDMNAWWTGLFWRNGRNNLKTDGITVSDWSIKMDVNVLATVNGNFKFRLKGTEGDFWAVIPGFQAKGGWYTITIPLSSFNDNGKLINDMHSIDSDFGLAYAGPGEHVNMCIDNVRFERTSGTSGAPKFKLIGF